MKLRKFLSCIICLSIILVGLSSVDCAENIIENPGFEIKKPGTNLPENWFLNLWSKTQGTAKLSEHSHSGKYSVRLKWLSGDTNIVLLAGLKNPVLGKQTFVLTCYLKTSEHGVAFCSFQTRDKNNKQIQFDYSKRLKNKTKWTKLKWEFTIAPETQKLYIWLRNGGKGSVWFDDVLLEETH